MIKITLTYLFAFFMCFQLMAQYEESRILRRAQQVLDEKKALGNSDGVGPSTGDPDIDRMERAQKSLFNAIDNKISSSGPKISSDFTSINQTEREKQADISRMMVETYRPDLYESMQNKSIRDETAKDLEDLTIKDFLNNYYWLLLMAVILLLLFSMFGSKKSKRK